MFENQDDLPDSSPLKNIKISDLEIDITLLKNKQDKILKEITSLLGK